MELIHAETTPEVTFTVESFGMGPYMEYRIPGIIVTEKGTIICCYEGRMDTHNDWAQIDIVVCRSSDGGEHFARQVIASTDEAADDSGKREPVTWNNPVLIRDGELVHLVFHRNYETAYHCVSLDDGLTFSEPVEITAAFREFPWEWNVCASGPGHGLVTKRGRLVIPIWLACGKSLDETGRKKAHQPSTAGAIYSDDRGKTWHAGPLVDGIVSANETAAVERSDGTVLFNFRNKEPDGCRAFGISRDGAGEFERIWREPGLPDPECFGSMARLDEGRIGFVNCANRERNHLLGERIFLTVSVSGDDGESWKPSVLVDIYGGYADMAVDGDRLYVFYEQSTWNEKLKRVNHLMLKRFRLERREDL